MWRNGENDGGNDDPEDVTVNDMGNDKHMRGGCVSSEDHQNRMCAAPPVIRQDSSNVILLTSL